MPSNHVQATDAVGRCWRGLEKPPAVIDSDIVDIRSSYENWTESNSDDRVCVIIGAGPAGLTAAYELSQTGFVPLVLEQDQIVGGIARISFSSIGDEIATVIEDSFGLCRHLAKSRCLDRRTADPLLWNMILEFGIVGAPRRQGVTYGCRSRALAASQHA